MSKYATHPHSHTGRELPDPQSGCQHSQHGSNFDVCGQVTGCDQGYLRRKGCRTEGNDYRNGNQREYL
jgi:hypothetical protein